MATTKQKKIAKLLIENEFLDKPLTGKQMLAKVSYSEGLQKQPSRILESEGVKEALNDYGFNEENAKAVVAEILLNSDNEPHSRLKAADMTFKVYGSYAAEKSTSLNVNVEARVDDKDDLNVIREKFDAELKAKLLQ
jgi:hypothetical protein